MNTILFFTPVQSPDALETIAGIRLVTARRGLHLQIVAREPTAMLVRELMQLWSPLGAILDCGSIWGEINPALFGDLPIVLLHHAPETLPPGMTAVRHASEETGRTAARELLATGCRHFAFVHYPTRKYWSDLRWRAFADTIRLHGYRCGVMAPSDGGTGADATWQGRLRAFLRGLPKPCALFAANDATAAEVLAAARHEGIKVPETLAVLGVDDDEICEQTVPTLSSIKPNFRNAGVLAALRLMEVAAGDAAAASGEVAFGDLGVVRRASTAPSHDKFVDEALERIRKEACWGLRPADVATLFPGTRRVADLRFKRAVGRTIGEEIHAVQLETAKRLLADGSRRIDAICDFCGFSTSGAMRKFFRRETGKSMREWRRENATEPHSRLTPTTR